MAFETVLYKNLLLEVWACFAFILLLLCAPSSCPIKISFKFRSKPIGKYRPEREQSHLYAGSSKE